MRPVSTGHSGMTTSRLAFRMQRCFYTPVVRWTLGVVCPVLLAASAVAYLLVSIDLVQSASGGFTSVARYFKDRPGFAITGASVEADSQELEDRVLDHVARLFPASPFSIDFANLRMDIIEAIPAVRDVDLSLSEDGLVHIAIDGREPKVICRMPDGLVLLDEEGAPVGRISSRSEFAHLTLIFGEGAELAVAEALRLIKIARPVEDMVRGFRRVGSRRWDMVLDKGRMILLPESGSEQAMEKVLQLNASHSLLNRRLVSIDMRDSRRVVVQAYPDDAIELRSPVVDHSG